MIYEFLLEINSVPDETDFDEQPPPIQEAGINFVGIGIVFLAISITVG